MARGVTSKKIRLICTLCRKFYAADPRAKGRINTFCKECRVVREILNQSSFLGSSRGNEIQVDEEEGSERDDVGGAVDPGVER